jgi:hypothetical protein
MKTATAGLWDETNTVAVAPTRIQQSIVQPANDLQPSTDF